MGSDSERAATFEGLAQRRRASARPRRSRAPTARRARRSRSARRERRARGAHRAAARPDQGGAASEPTPPAAHPRPMGTRRLTALLLVDKPAGMTSHDVVLAARRAFGESRIGHAGTLDPFATGLLVLLLGRATRLLPYLDGEPKVYEATIAFGARDRHRRLRRRHAARRVRRRPMRPSPRRIAQLTGEIDQVPPAYSAKQVERPRAYEAARARRRPRARAIARHRVRLARRRARGRHPARHDRVRRRHLHPRPRA